MAPLGMSFFFTSPAPSGIEVVEAGMLITIQCQKPLPVGASGSYTVTAKLLVSAGAPDQLSSGERFLPLQPKLLNTNSSGIFPFGLRSADFNSKAQPVALTSSAE